MYRAIQDATEGKIIVNSGDNYLDTYRELFRWAKGSAAALTTPPAATATHSQSLKPS